MKCDHGETAVGRQPRRNPLEGDPETLELFIDRNAECLKRARGRMNARRGILPWDGGRDDAREIAGRTDRLTLAHGRDATGDPSCETLFTKLLDDVGKRLGTHAIDHPPGRLALGGIKSKIEGAFGVKREATCLVGELVARKTDVEKHAIDAVDGQRVEHLRNVAEVGLGEADRFSRHLLGTTADGHRIAVDRDDEALGTDRFCEEPRVASAAEGSVDDPHARLDGEQRHHLGGENRSVDTRTGEHPLTVTGFVRTILRMAEADLYDYDLPRELIAQEPRADRASARLLVVRRSDRSLEHRHVRDLPDLLAPGDLVVVNDTRVVPARLVGRRAATGGAWEGLFLQVERTGLHAGVWRLLAQTRGRPAFGERIVLVDRKGRDAAEVELVGRAEGGAWLARPVVDEPAEVVLGRVGRVPLPGYIRGGADVPGDVERYQTVFARESGSAAAPTAGLHFTEGLLEALTRRGIARATVTLHVGLDTFRPITVDRLDDHTMHTEWCVCPSETAVAIKATRARGGRVVAIGTTAVRTLETAARASPPGETITAWSGPTDLFIRPGHAFQSIDGLLTNFHMPRTTLMVLVSTFAGRELVAQAYAEAIRDRYRFLSYGDAMLFL